MAKKTEAQLILKIKTMGKETIDAAGKSFTSLKDKMGKIVDVGKKLAIGITGIVTAMGTLAVKAAKFKQVEDAFISLAEAQGKSAAKILSNMRSLTEGMVSDLDLMVAANKAALLGLPLDSFPEMLKIAKSASEATGESMQFMLDSIVVGLGRQSKLILDNLGIIIDIDKAYQNHAKTLKTTADQLSENEKQQAFINEAMRIGVENADKMKSSGDNASKAWQRLKATFENAAVTLGENLNPAMTDLFNLMGDFLDLSIDMAQSNWLSAMLEESAIMAVEFGTAFANAIDGVRSIWGDSNELNRKVQQRTEDAMRKIEDIRTRYGVERLKQADERNRERLEAEKETEEEIGENRLSVQERILKEINDQEKDALEKRKVDKEKIQAEIDKIDAAGPAGPEADTEKAGLDSAAKTMVGASETQVKAANLIAEGAGLLTTSLNDPVSGVAAIAGTITNAFAPGMGGPVQEMIQLLAKGPEEVTAMVNGFVDALPDIIDNIAESIPALIIAIIDNLDRIMLALAGASGKMIAALWENAPEIVSAMARAIDESFNEARRDIVRTLNDILVQQFGNAGDQFVASIMASAESFAEQFSGIFDDIGEAIANVPETLKKMLGDSAVAFGEALQGGAKQFVNQIMDLFEELPNIFANIDDVLIGVFEEGVGAIEDALSDAFDVLGKVFEAFLDLPEKIAKSLVPGGGDIVNKAKNEFEKVTGIKLQHGGFVPGVQRLAAGGTVDTVNTRLTPGEFVVNSRAAAANASLLQSINNGQQPMSQGSGGVTIVVNGGLLGDEATAKQFAKAVDEQLLKLRQGNESVAFDTGVF